MSDMDMLLQWKQNTEKMLEEDRNELHELENSKTDDIKRYLFHANLIRHWLKENGDDLSENIKESLEWELNFLESEPKEIERKILMLEKDIERHTFLISKLSQIIKSIN